MTIKLRKFKNKTPHFSRWVRTQRRWKRSMIPIVSRRVFSTDELLQMTRTNYSRFEDWVAGRLLATDGELEPDDPELAAVIAAGCERIQNSWTYQEEMNRLHGDIPTKEFELLGKLETPVVETLPSRWDVLDEPNSMRADQDYWQHQIGG